MVVTCIIEETFRIYDIKFTEREGKIKMDYIWPIINAIIGYFLLNYLILIDKIKRTKFYLDSIKDSAETKEYDTKYLNLKTTFALLLTIANSMILIAIYKQSIINITCILYNILIIILFCLLTFRRHISFCNRN